MVSCITQDLYLVICNRRNEDQMIVMDNTKFRITIVINKSLGVSSHFMINSIKKIIE